MEDIGFWQHNNAIKDREKIVWLLLYDLQGRKFAKPQFEIANSEEREEIFEVGFHRSFFPPFASFHSPTPFSPFTLLVSLSTDLHACICSRILKIYSTPRNCTYQAAGLADVENALLNVKTRLAASISRLRIRGSALNLGEYFSSDVIELW